MYHFEVPEGKRIRMLIYTDCANEADDQYALAHQLMTPLLDVKGIIAGHFDYNTRIEGYPYKPGETAKASFNEILKVLDLMDLKGKYRVAMGAGTPLKDEKTPIESEAVRMIIDEALKEDERPLYIGCQGSLTDLASAILIEPKICDRMTAIWIGGGDYPEGGFEFNLLQDINAANVLFSSKMPVWQVPMHVYKSLSVSLAELECKVYPQGQIGKYLFENMVRLNSMIDKGEWPHGEIWGLGDQGVIATLMQEHEKHDNYHYEPAPRIDLKDMGYVKCKNNREIRVYDSVEVRLTLEDFFCKLKLNFGR